MEKDKLLEINIQISEIEEMITHFLILREIHPDQEIYVDELAFWRRYLQRAKIIKREVLAAI